MSRTLILLIACVTLSLPGSRAQAGHPFVHADRSARWYNANYSWHGGYSNVEWGHPVAVIVPPTATMQTEYSWGVGRTQMSPIRHQFARPVAQLSGSGPLPPSPRWPSRTQQLGFYSGPRPLVDLGGRGPQTCSSAPLPKGQLVSGRVAPFLFTDRWAITPPALRPSQRRGWRSGCGCARQWTLTRR